MAKVIIIGPGHPLRGGGLTTFNHRLAKELIEQGHDCQIYSFSLQYPSFLFPGKTQYSDEAAPEGIIIKSVINSINPFNWLKIGNRLKKERADIIIVRYWLPFMGPSLGTILRKVRKNRHTKIICLADNVIPHEKRMGDKPFTKYFLKSCDAFITMSEKVMSDLRLFQKTLPTGRQAKPAILVPHPLYDNFGAILSKQEAREKLKIKNDALILLFFGFIRKYKGLDILFEAMADERIKKAGIRLLVAGEFYEDERKYKDQIDTLGIREQLILRTDFIPDNDVKYYLCAADAVVQPYRNATQSGVSPLAYHFEKPMIVTNVGGLPALVPDGKAGLVTAPTPEAIADAILKFYQLGENYFIPHLRTEKQKYSWTNMVSTIFQLAKEIQK
ncbi:MAG: glycosyltransferase [Chitinophagaceae bacterium]|jgi:glycosyltransferase involved in cell wall biosynthesis|nr:glycosyltransferase [Chitinophagaceae bacterium]MBK8299307.1 glycosyltransferase [Chitinophagaceae bacterium]MBK9936950.1 glycosyltransferase [Chitinophagaceae bacterium]MBP6234028.1 glycosyltransferase [Chitinophagaceae bacterium]MBP6416040.1 glycosyltransferase [Chitinophagaceae bacterium]